MYIFTHLLIPPNIVVCITLIIIVKIDIIHGSLSTWIYRLILEC